MPYNTRRKSLSLPSLGIHVPVSHADRDAARAAAAAALANRQSPPSSALGSTASSSPAFSPRFFSPRTPASPAESMDAQAPASRKIKRPHVTDVDARPSNAPAAKRHRSDATTPPPSPRPFRATSIEMRDADDYASAAPIDLGSINDEIVEAVVVQLQSTNNRPHIVKELAAILTQQLKIVQQ